MSDDDVKAIAAALETPDADLLRLRIGWHGESWLRALIADRERLVLKIECLENHMDDHAITAAVHEYEQVLAALDAGQEAG